MDFGVEFVPESLVDEVVEKVKVADKTNFDYVWITDHYNNRNVYAVLTKIAEETEKINLGPGVTNPYTIEPAQTASAIATISELSNGRAVLGIGPGDKTTLDSLGLEWDKPLTRTREAIEIINRLLSGEKVATENMEKHDLNGAELNFEPEEEIPVFIGAQGPNMLKMAGKNGDGVLINASHPKDFDYAVGQIEKGIQEAGRDKEAVEIVAYTSFSVAEDMESAKEAAVPPVAFIVAGVPDVVLDRHDISSEKAGEIGEALGEGDFGTAFGLVTDEMIDAFALYGTPEECVERIESLKDRGVTQIVAGSPIGPDKKESMKVISDKIMLVF
ncbi:methylene-tetrahydromethanopterin reductase [candidate division MSBL1 archaeon SCGC-AAA259E19]|uniref:5,10-methylenetetrahydromethanopterin reductase n=1 Tax=candidate division MSBL1 archaeon SCGC-AAA259E19 TaxID=1698264 RepID=A0A133UKD4_9EURY|nr:methylene-tetrahydromethanopterin reductase [candidate division MSBL1 archaeon SCGC-AAA259E19]